MPDPKGELEKKLDNALMLLQRIADRMEGLHSRLERIEAKLVK